MQHKENSIFEAAAKVMTPPNIQKMIDDYEDAKDSISDLFYEYQQKIDAVQKKAAEDIKKLRKEQEEKSTKISITMDSDFEKKMKPLGYEFSALKGWHKK